MSTSSFENAAVLAAKLSVPRLRSDRVRRPRLVELLESAVGSRLVFIKAPAGFGKTTLIADWLAASRRPFAWLSVYREEPSAEIFLARLEAALDAALGDRSPPWRRVPTRVSSSRWRRASRTPASPSSS